MHGKHALAGDPVSAFGGVLITNRTIDLETAEEMNKIFFEVVIAPGYDEDALQVLKQKKNRIILIQREHRDERQDDPHHPQWCYGAGPGHVHRVGRRDENSDHKEAISPKQLADLVFANKIVKHTKSNAIVLAKEQAAGGLRCWTDLTGWMP